MHNVKRFLMVLIAVIFVFSSVGTAAAAPQAQNCRAYHTVRYGETLSSIGAAYGVYWPYLAQVNNIQPPRYVVRAGMRLCIPTWSGGWTGWGTGGPNPIPVRTGGVRTWSFSVTGVNPNTSVTIQTHNLPDWVTFNVRIGRYNAGGFDWVNLPDLQTEAGGTRTITFNIPASFSGASQLVLRLVQVKRNGRVFSQDQTFFNTAGSGGPYPYPPYGYWGIPTIWIVGVQANTSVTIQTRNFPPGVTFDVLMGPMGTRAVGGYLVGTLYSGTGGTMTATFSIPAQLVGHRQIAIRTQNWPTGYFSYNWFFNNTY